jgi:hypothetical protein
MGASTGYRMIELDNIKIGLISKTQTHLPGTFIGVARDNRLLGRKVHGINTRTTAAAGQLHD